MDLKQLSQNRIYLIIAGVAAVSVIAVIFLIIVTTGGGDAFTRECIKIHNHYRKLHNAQPLEEDKDLIKSATAVAKSNANKDGLEHSGGDAGENLFMHSIQSAPCEYAVKAWYDEIKLYDFSGVYKQEIGHFTQVVWKDSKKLGCGRAVGKSGTYIACQYLPRGNVIGSFNENVLRQS